MRYYEIPKDTFDGLVTESGVLLKNFDIQAAASDPTTPGFTNADIICATTGGVQISLAPTYSDLGEDVDNCPLNMLELKHLDSWEAKFSTTGLGVTPQNIKDALGVADIDTDGNKITPRMSLQRSDFQSIWWVSDKANGGLVAVKLDNALATSGFSLQTGKNTKSQTTLEFTGHVSINAQDVVPMTFYSINPSETVTYAITQALTNVTSSLSDESIEAGSALTATLTADDGYEIDTVTVVMGEEDITSTAWDSETGKVTIASVTGDVVITATADGV